MISWNVNIIEHLTALRDEYFVMKEDKDYYQGGGNGKTVKLYSYDADGKRSVYDNYDKL